MIPRRDYDIMKTDRENLVGEMSNLKDQFDILQQEHQALLEAHAEVYLITSYRETKSSCRLLNKEMSFIRS